MNHIVGSAEKQVVLKEKIDERKRDALLSSGDLLQLLQTIKA